MHAIPTPTEMRYWLCSSSGDCEARAAPGWHSSSSIAAVAAPAAAVAAWRRALLGAGAVAGLAGSACGLGAGVGCWWALHPGVCDSGGVRLRTRSHRRPGSAAICILCGAGPPALQAVVQAPRGEADPRTPRQDRRNWRLGKADQLRLEHAVGKGAQHHSRAELRAILVTVWWGRRNQHT